MMTPGLPVVASMAKATRYRPKCFLLPSLIMARVPVGARKNRTPDAVVAKGQAIPLPVGHYNRVYLLAASADGDQTAAFRVGAKTANLNIEDWGGFIGQWDTRIFRNQDDRNWDISAHHALASPR